MVATAPYRLVIELDDRRRHVYRAYFVDDSRGRREEFATLDYTLANVDGVEDALERWRDFLDSIFKDTVIATYGLIPHEVRLERLNLDTYAHVGEEPA